MGQHTVNAILILDDGTLVLSPSAGGESAARFATLGALRAAWGDAGLKAALRAIGVATTDAPPGIPLITTVQPSVLNTDKAWYEAGYVLGPYNGHPDYAADWNLETMGDSDLGEPVGAPFAGLVINAHDYQGSWGNIVQIVGLRADGVLVTWMGAHLRKMLVTPGQIVEPGTPVGEIGKGHNNMYSAHLHEQFALGEVPPANRFVHGPPFVAPFEFYIDHGVPRALMERLRAKDKA